MDAGQLYRHYQMKTISGEIKPGDTFPCRDEFTAQHATDDGAELVWDSLVQLDAIGCSCEGHPHQVQFTPWPA